MEPAQHTAFPDPTPEQLDATKQAYNEAMARIQTVLDTPGYNPAGLQEAEDAAGLFLARPEKMRQDIETYHATKNGVPFIE